MSTPRMRAKFYVTDASKCTNETTGETTQIILSMSAVSEKPFDPDGVSDDNDFARWSPCGSFQIQIANPNLFDAFTVGDKYYLDFTKAESNSRICGPSLINSTESNKN